ncbi:MAG: T9SS type A sorting domain-containing protein [Paludibacter sp.]
MRTIHEITTKIGFVVVVLFVSAINIQAQAPAYLCELRNDAQVDTKTFEFDVYLLQTGTTAFEYTSMQMGININPGLANSGVITPTFMVGSDLNPGQIFTANRLTFNADRNCIIVTGVPGPGSGAGTIISNTGFGTKICRIRLTNSVDFGKVRPDLTWSFSLTNGYQTKVNAYIPLATDITVQASHTTRHLANLIMNRLVTPQTVTGGGSYCQGSTGVAVGLANSEVGVTYTLYKNGTATSTSVAGTGSAIWFPAQAAGAYTVKGSFVNGSNIWGTTDMIGNAVVVENPLLVASVSITVSRNNICEDCTPVTFTATPINGGTSPGYQWYKGTTMVGSNSPTFTYIPANGDVIKVVMISNASPCLTGSPSTSNKITMVVCPVINAAVSISASANPVSVGCPVTFTATPYGGGATPTYQWYKNSGPVGNGTSTFTYVPADLDQVYVVMTSSASPCVTGSPATSNTIVMSVSIGTSTDEVKEKPQVYVYSQDGNIYLNSPDEINQVYIYSAMGQALMLERNAGGIRKFDLNNHQAAYYFIKIVTAKGVYCQKVLLNK